MATDAFIAAFRIPNLLRDMFAEGALSAAFVPVFKDKLVNSSRSDAFRLACVVLTAILVVVGALVLIGIAAAPVLVYTTAYGFTDSPEKFEITTNLTRIMMAYLLLVSLSALIMGMLNSVGRFAIPALSPAMFNMGVVLAVALLYRYFHQPVYVLAIGVLVGGIGQLVIQIPSLIQIGFRFRPIFDLLDEGLKRVVRLIMPMILGLSASRVNILVSTLLASLLVEGSISYLNFSYRLMHFPLGVFAVALGTVTLPRVSEMVARGDTKNLTRAFHEAIGLNLFVVMPSAVFLAVMGHDLVELIYQWGRFSPEATANTALALKHYSYGLIGFAAVRVAVPFFYAWGDSKLPMKISIITVVLNIALYYPLIQVLDFAGLAAATSIAGLVNFTLLLFFLPGKSVDIRFWYLMLKILRVGVAATIAFQAAIYVPSLAPTSASEVLIRIIDLLVPLTTAAILYLLLCLLLKVGEVRQLFRMLVPGRRTEG